MINISLFSYRFVVETKLTRTAKCSRYQRLTSIYAGIIRKKTLSAVGVNSHRTKTQRCSCMCSNAAGRPQHCFFTSSNSILKWDRSLSLSWRPIVNCRLITVHFGVQPTAVDLGKNEKCLFSTTQEFKIIFWKHGLNRHQGFIHSVGGFKKPIYRKTKQAKLINLLNQLKSKKISIIYL